MTCPQAYAYANGSPLKYVDSMGLTASDVRKIQRWAHDGILTMTALGLRNPNPYVNNMSSNLTPGFLDPNPYLMCSGQVNWMLDWLRAKEAASPLDDPWNHHLMTRTIGPPGSPLGHRWICSKSYGNCDDDDNVMIDPWYGLVATCPRGTPCEAVVPWWVPVVATMTDIGAWQ